MPRKRKVVKVNRRGRIVEIALWVHEFNERKKAERAAKKRLGKSVR